MPVEPAMVLAANIISAMPSTEQMEDSFTMVTTSLASAGRTFFTACGSTHQTHTLPLGETQRAGGLRLSLIHGQNTGTENFAT